MPHEGLNDQFSGPNVWDEYLKRIEDAVPAVQALGITDYWSLDRYEKVWAHRANGRLPGVGLIFPNVEIRFATGDIYADWDIDQLAATMDDVLAQDEDDEDARFAIVPPSPPQKQPICSGNEEPVETSGIEPAIGTTGRDQDVRCRASRSLW